MRALEKERIVVALVGVSEPGYTSQANAYLREALKSDSRLPEIWVTTLDFEISFDPWWMVYRILELDPVPDFVCFSVYCWNAEAIFTVSRILSSINPVISLVVGGPEVGPTPGETLARHGEIFAVVEGEGERTLPEIMLSFARGGDPFGIDGVSVNDNGRVKVGPPAKPIADLDSVASPYTDAHPPATDGSAYLESFRGCPHRCAYCFEAKGSTRIRSHSWKRIERDVARMASTPGMTAFSFIDSVFNLTSDRLKKLADIMEPWAKRGIRLHTIEVDIEAIDESQAKDLKRAGVASVETGPQTTGCKALRACSRTLDKEKYLRGVAACRKAGITVEADLIIGLPGDTVEDVLDSLRFVLSADPGTLQISTLRVLPGTPLWDEADDLGVVFDHETPHEVVATETLGFAELRQLEVFGVALQKLYRSKK
ncbi:MAG: B12-binding domain-containing radical SAM protein [Coriobacteriia bacterium]|nr:B12-binding domain-containing radical SAM protein [Coriobacteriia bacterium]